jgi:3-oxoacyl-[acyl-carrier protein] reductase
LRALGPGSFCNIQVEALFQTSKRQFGYPITTVVNNALSSFSFDGDERPKLDTITWEAFDSQLKGSLQGAFNTTKGILDLVDSI